MEGGYRSFAPYVAKAKEVHLLGGFAWSPLLDLVVKKACYSVSRGVGLARQSQPFDLLQAVDAVNAGRVDLAADAPIGWCNFLIVGTFFIMREIEIAFAVVGHVRIDLAQQKVTLLLPVSKKDPKAVGCERSWACLCRADASAPRGDCPFHAISGQLGLLERSFGSPLHGNLPLFPDVHGRAVSKTAVVAALEATVHGYGGKVRGLSGENLLGGHSFRVTGAQRLAAMGIEVVKIMVLARWAGDTILRYVKEAPLCSLHDDVRALEGRQDSLRALRKLVDGAELLEGKLSCLEQELSRLKALKSADKVSDDASQALVGCLPYVTNGRSRLSKKFRVHVVKSHGPELHPHQWKTVCGIRFAFCGFEQLPDCSSFAKHALCKSCVGRDEPVSSTDSSSSLSSSAPSAVSDSE